MTDFLFGRYVHVLRPTVNVFDEWITERTSRCQKKISMSCHCHINCQIIILVSCLSNSCVFGRVCVALLVILLHGFAYLLAALVVKKIERTINTVIYISFTAY